MDTRRFTYQIIPTEGVPFKSRLVTVRIADDGERPWLDVVAEADEKAHAYALEICKGNEFDVIEE